jgi:hypothetical protein
MSVSAVHDRVTEIEVCRDYLDVTEIGRDYCVRRFWLILLFFTIATIGAILLLIEAPKPKVVVVSSSDGDAQVIQPVPYNFTIMAPDWAKQWTETIETLLTRNEKGVPKDLSEFVDEKVLSVVNAQFQSRIAKFGGKGYSQKFEVNDLIPVEGTPAIFKVMVEGILSSYALDNHHRNLIWLNLTFEHRQGTLRNAAGWKLTELSPGTEESFYANRKSDLIKTKTHEE